MTLARFFELVLLSLSTVGLAMAASPSAAQTWPIKPIRMVVGFPPGALPEVLGRVVAAKMTPALGQSIIVESKPGAAGSIAASEVARAAPDGYTIMVGVAANLAVAPHLLPSANYDPSKAFAAIGIIQRSPYFVTARSDLPVANLRDLIAYAKANPDKLNFATPGTGTPHHLTWELLMLRTGMKMTHIPVQAAQMVTETLAGRTHVFMDSATSPIVSNVKTGNFKFLAMTGAARMNAQPQVPTVAEQGVSGVASYAYNGLVAPAGTPREIIVRLNAELNRALAMSDVLERLRAEGVPTEQGVSSTPEEFAAWIASEYAGWGKVIKDAGIVLK